jgi:hypothetical protein
MVFLMVKSQLQKPQQEKNCFGTKNGLKILGFVEDANRKLIAVK